MDTKFDVIIIGAGPAGLSCAESLKNSKLKVLILEKNKIIGPKVCGGGLTFLDKQFNLPLNKSRIFKKQATYLNKNRSVVNLINPLRTMSRSDLGEFMVSKISDAKNITIKKDIFVKEIGGNTITTSDGKYYFDFLVGADGSNSIVRKHLNLPSKYYMGIQYILPKIMQEMAWFLNPKSIGSGYGWIFPHINYTSVGVFFDPKKITATIAKRALDNFLSEQKIDARDAKLEAAPINCKYVGLKFKNIFLAGDAAGLASACTGEGIAYAITSGEEIGKMILNEDFNPARIKKIIKYKNRQERILNIFNALPFFQNSLFKLFIFLFRFPYFQKFFGN